ncbi:hypothetical protein MKX03_028683 [Papaver bracteatum]|nr:hypothetical protein MKX03_028683 [Papaver bracteatum]
MGKQSNSIWVPASDKLSSPEKAAEIEEFFATRTKPCFVRALQQSLEWVDINANWVRSVQDEKSFEEVVKEMARKNY